MSEWKDNLRRIEGRDRTILITALNYYIQHLQIQKETRTLNKALALHHRLHTAPIFTLEGTRDEQAL